MNQVGVCKIEHNNFPLEDAELGVFDTHKLSKLISITNGELMVSLEKIKAVYTKMHFADANFRFNLFTSRYPYFR